MAMSKAFRGLALPDFKKQSCGHFFNAAGCDVCPHCRKRAKRPPADSEKLKLQAARALQAASSGRLSLADAKAFVLDILE